jgi:hypothetical protein
MLNFIASRFSAWLMAAVILILSGCSPTYDWREVQGTDAPFTVMLPAKPATYSRAVNLNGLQVSMTMTAARVKNASFAVGSAPVSDPKQAAAALQAMKTAMVKNIGGTIKKEKRLPADANLAESIQIEASGIVSNGGTSQPVALLAQFMAKNGRIYQVIALGPESDLPPEEVEMFFSSFKAN